MKLVQDIDMKASEGLEQVPFSLSVWAEDAVVPSCWLIYRSCLSLLGWDNHRAYCWRNLGIRNSASIIIAARCSTASLNKWLRKLNLPPGLSIRGQWDQLDAQSASW